MRPRPSLPASCFSLAARLRPHATQRSGRCGFLLVRDSVEPRWCGGRIEELERIVGQLRRRWPKVRIHIRGDSGFCRESIMKWCEERSSANVWPSALGHTGHPARRYRDFTYRTRKSWSRRRRVVGKAEYLSKGANPRFVVTSLSPHKASARRVEKLYYALEVRRPHQHPHDARQSVALVLLLIRLCPHARPSKTRHRRHRAGPCPVFHSSPEAVQMDNESFNGMGGNRASVLAGRFGDFDSGHAVRGVAG